MTSVGVQHAKWRKLGRVFGPEMGAAWMKSHAQVPTPFFDEARGVIRVYFSSRPERGLSLTSFVDLDAENPTRVVGVNTTPLLEVGPPGSFDEHGIMPSCAVEKGGRVYLFYSGWSRSVSVPYTNTTGLAVSEDGGLTFQKVSIGPVLGRSIYDPYSATSPFVRADESSWRMWYCSGTGWPVVDGKHEHTYDIKEAVSKDGRIWAATGRIALEATAEQEALTRPWIVSHKNGWELFYCHRRTAQFRDGAGAYRIGVASSNDCSTWQRHRSLDLASRPGDWDEHAQAYPALLIMNKRILLFYNGNDFGASGFGIAVADAN